MNSGTTTVATNFLEVAKLAGVNISLDDLRIDALSAPHRPTGLPFGSMAVYVFSYRGTTLKVGKAGPNSDARFRSQHYNAASAPSTLAASILKDSAPIGNPVVDLSSVGDWIKQNTDRTNYILKARYGIGVLTLLEAYLQCLLKPVYEGFASQK